MKGINRIKNKPAMFFQFHQVEINDFQEKKKIWSFGSIT